MYSLVSMIFAVEKLLCQIQLPPNRFARDTESSVGVSVAISSLMHSISMCMSMCLCSLYVCLLICVSV